MGECWSSRAARMSTVVKSDFCGMRDGRDLIYIII
jgi:hypothetical protein